MNESAVSYFILNEHWDEGKLLTQIPFSIHQDDDWRSVENIIQDVVKQTLPDTIEMYLGGKLEPKEQKGVASPTAAYESYRQIRWRDETVREIVNKVGLYPWIDPFTYCWFPYKNRQRILRGVVKCEHVPNGVKENAKLWHSGGHLYFQAKDGLLVARLFIDIDVMTSIGIILEGSIPRRIRELAI